MRFCENKEQILEEEFNELKCKFETVIEEKQEYYRAFLLELK